MNLGAIIPVDRAPQQLAPPEHTRGQGSCTTCGYRRGTLPRCPTCKQRSLHRIVLGRGDLACEHGCPRNAGLLEKWRAEMRAALAALEALPHLVGGRR